jgi:hypothetical protein
MVQDYGFMVLNNELNSERVYLPKTMPRYAQKKKMIGDREFVTMYHHLLPLDVTWFYRLVSARNLKSPFWYFPSTVKAEILTLNTCMTHVSTMLKEMRTSIGEDYALYHQLSFGNKKTAIGYRIGRKRVLLRMRTACGLALEEITQCMSVRGLRKPWYARMLYELFWAYIP